MRKCSSCRNLMVVQSDEDGRRKFLKYVCGHPLHDAYDALPAMLGMKSAASEKCDDYEMGRKEEIDVPLEEWEPFMDEPTFSPEMREKYRDLGLKYRKVNDVG